MRRHQNVDADVRPHGFVYHGFGFSSLIRDRQPGNIIDIHEF